MEGKLKTKRVFLGYIKCPITFILPQSLRTNPRCYFTRYFGLTMEKLLANKPAFIKATPPASTMLAAPDEERRNLERMSDDLEQASSQAWLDAQHAAKRMLAKSGKKGNKNEAAQS